MNSRIRTFCRIRPESDKCNELHISSDSSIEVTCDGDRSWQFQMDGVFPETASQADVYSNCVPDLIDQFLNYNRNVTIFAYGQTGSGKTHTLLGNDENPGITFQFINDIFSRLRVPLLISVLEIYNDRLSDLLSFDESADIKLFETYSGEIAIRGLQTRCATNPYQAATIIEESARKRRTAGHDMNESSSRSHCVFMFSYSQADSAPKFNIVDLAGSERVSKTNSEGIILKEAGCINKSLSFLEQTVIAALDRHRSHIPYRQCVLTQLLRDSIGGNSLLTMIACLWPHADHLQECISTLRFVARMMRLKRKKVVMNKPDQEDGKFELERLRLQVNILSQELTLRNTNHFQARDDHIVKEEEVNRTVSLFLNNGIDPKISSPFHALQMMKCMRGLMTIEQPRITQPTITPPVKQQVTTKPVLSQKELLDVYRAGDGKSFEDSYKLAKKEVKSITRELAKQSGGDVMALEMSLIDAKARQEFLQLALLNGFENWLKTENCI